MKRLSKPIASALAALLAITGIGAAALAAHASNQTDWVPSMTASTGWQGVQVVKVDGDLVYQRALTRNATTTTTVDPEFVGDVLTFYSDQTVTLDYTIRLNTDNVSWFPATYNQIASVIWNPYIGDAFWSGDQISTDPACTPPTGIFLKGSGVIEFDCTSTLVIPSSLTANQSNVLPTPVVGIRSQNTVTPQMVENDSLGSGAAQQSYAIGSSGGSWIYGGAVAPVIDPEPEPEPVVPDILPADRSYVAQVGHQITIDLATLAATCTMSDETLCAPDSATFSGLPNGATVLGNSFAWTPKAVGDVDFNFVLTDSTTGATSAVTTQSISASATPSIIPATQWYQTDIGVPITVDLAEISADCTVTDGSACDPDQIQYPDIPDEATVSGESITFNPTAAGLLEFTFILTDTTTGATSPETVGTVEVLAEPSHIIAVSKTYTIKVGETIRITSPMLTEGATDSITGEPVEPLIAGIPATYADFEDFPVGATIFNIEPNGNGIEFSSLVPGTYEIRYILNHVSKFASVDGVVTSYIVVTPEDIKKPTVTG